MQMELLVVLSYLVKKDPKGVIEIIDSMLSRVSNSKDTEILQTLKQRTLRILKAKENGSN